MKIITKYKNYILGVIGVLLALTMFVGVKYLMKPKYEELPEVKLREVVNKDKSFAIMIQEKSETDKYQEYSSNTWPGDDYKFKEAKCTDNNGILVKDAVTYEEGKITLTTNKTIYCTIYFDKSIIGKLRENEELANKDNLSKNLQGGMYRYQGTDNVHNWICFGTKENCGTNDDNVDKYMYRIMGVTKEGQLYLIKETFLKEGNATSFIWNDKYSVDSSKSGYCDNGICPEWNTSLLFKRINGISNGTTQGTGTTSNKADTDIFVDSTQYDYLKSGDSNSGGRASEWYNLIANHEWLYGDVGEDSSANKYNGDVMYAIEHGEKETTHNVGTKDNITQEPYTWSQKVNAKISLMYLHDYYYSYYDGLAEESRGNAESHVKLVNSWMHFRKDEYNTSQDHEWSVTRWGVFVHRTEGAIVSGYYIDMASLWQLSWLIFPSGVRPVFYLTSNVEIKTGNGTKSNPFILDF